MLGGVDILAKPSQEINTTSSQANPLEHPSSCESVRITLVDGRKIETGSYRHQGNHVEITKKGRIQTIIDKDIKLTEVRQGSCPDIVVTLKTGERIEGYRRDHVATLKKGQRFEGYLPDQNISDRFDLRTEIRQKDKVLTIADSDIKTVRLKFKETFGEKLKNAALIPVIPFVYLILFIACSRGGCNDL
jgi:hypothetical protein